MSLSTKRICPVCEAKFEPIVEWQVCDTRKCTNVLNVRRFRARKRCGGGDDGGGPRQRGLFPKLAKAKPPKPVRVPEPTLFPDDGGAQLLVTYGGAEYRDDSARPISTHSRYSVKSAHKPVAGVQSPLSGAPHAA